MATIAEQLTSLAETKTAIKDAIVAKGVSVADTDTFRSYADKIGEFCKTGYFIDSNGAFNPTSNYQFVGKGIKDVAYFAMYCLFYQNHFIVSAVLPDLEQISAHAACSYTFGLCIELISVSTPKLKKIAGSSSCQYMFINCQKLTEASAIENLEEISGTNSCHGMYQRCSGLTKVYFRKLTSVLDTTSLGTTSANGMFANCNNITEIHFRADAQAVIESLDGYPTKFGATNATIYFDL